MAYVGHVKASKLAIKYCVIMSTHYTKEQFLIRSASLQTTSNIFKRLFIIIWPILINLQLFNAAYLLLSKIAISLDGAFVPIVLALCLCVYLFYFVLFLYSRYANPLI